MRSFGFFLIIGLLAGCVGPIQTRVDSAGATDVQPISFAANGDATGVAVTARSKVTALLEKRGYSVTANPDLNLQVTVSDRPAELALKNGDATLSPSADKKRCAKRDYRLGITLIRISDGSVFYRASAAEFHCKLGIEDRLDDLANAALQDLGAPKGSYIVTRPRQ
jgi:hypothetical protein